VRAGSIEPQGHGALKTASLFRFASPIVAHWELKSDRAWPDFSKLSRRRS
jgi:hypothetical protein